MNVLFVINSLGPGGAERSLAEMLPRMAAHGIVPLVVCFDRWEEGVQAEVQAAGTDVRFLTGRGLPSRVAQLRRIVRTRRPDIVHTAIFEADIVGRIASTGSPARVLTSLINTPYDPARKDDPNVSAPALAAVRLVDGWTARHLTDHFHAITRAVRDAAVRDLGVSPDRITVIERGRDPARLGLPTAERRRRARRALGLDDADEVVVTVGRQEFQKGQRHLVEALAALQHERPRLVALLAGRTGHASAELQRLRKALPAPDRLQMLGHRDDLPEVLAGADLFVFPSVYEGLGGAVIEAMALGLPVVASDIAALREVVEADGNAFLVPPASAGALAQAIDELLSNPHLARRFGLRSRAIFEERFTLDESIARMSELYAGMLDEAPPAQYST